MSNRASPVALGATLLIAALWLAGQAVAESPKPGSGFDADPEGIVLQEAEAEAEAVAEAERELAIPTTAEQRHPVLVRGTGTFVSNVPVDQAESSIERSTTQLSFSETDVRQVISSVMGDVLGLTFTIDPTITGTMTLQSSRPLSKEDLFRTLEAALRLQDIVIVSSGSSYNVLPAKSQVRQLGAVRPTTGRRAPGYGIEVVPLEYVGAVDMERLLSPFVIPGSIVRIDEARNLLLLMGTSSELSTMRETIHTFDVSWLDGMSYAMYPVEYVDAKTLVKELEDIFNEDKSPLKGIVRLIPLSRLNMVLVASVQPEYLRKVEDWIKRLDLGTSAPGRRIYVYNVQNGRASDLANTLNEMFGLSSGGGRSDQSNRGVGFSRLGGGSSSVSSNGLGSSSGASSTFLAPTGSQNTSSGQGGQSSNLSLETLGLRVVPSEETNALLIFATPAEYSVLNNAVTVLDLPPPQVLIEATFVEVTLTDEIKFGVEWLFRNPSGVASFSASAAGGVLSRFPGLSYLYTGATNTQVVLNALEAITKVKVISSPKLMVLNNREAQIQVGDQVPILTQQAISTSQTGAPIVNSVGQRDTGVILHVTPRVNKAGLVTLEIAQEVSAVVPTTTSTIDSPTIQERSISSTVAVRDGETIALGGLIRDSRSGSSAGIPGLSKIPYLGWLFGVNDVIKDRTELLVLITPQVVRNDQEIDQLMQDMKEQFPATLSTFRKAQPARPSRALP